MLTYISALVRFLLEIRTLVHGYEQDKERNVSFFRDPLLTPQIPVFYGSLGEEIVLVTRL